MAVSRDSILPYILQWVMIYSFGINTDLRIDHKSIPHTDIIINSKLFNPPTRSTPPLREILDPPLICHVTGPSHTEQTDIPVFPK